MKPEAEHLTDLEIAALIEGSGSREAEAHLLICPDCRLVYEASGDALVEEMARERPRTARPSSRALVAAAVATAAAVLLVIWLPQRSSIDADLSKLSIPPALRAEMEKSSSRYLIYPGFEEHAGNGTPVLRRSATGSNRVGAEVDSLTRLIDASDASQSDTVLLIVSLIESMRLEQAATAMAAFERRWPDYPHIDFLRASVVYRSGRFQDAAEILGASCAPGEGHGRACLNYAVALVHGGSGDSARDVLESLLSRADLEGGVRKRAERILVDVGGY